MGAVDRGRNLWGVLDWIGCLLVMSFMGYGWMDGYMEWEERIFGMGFAILVIY